MIMNSGDLPHPNMDNDQDEDTLGASLGASSGGVIEGLATGIGAINVLGHDLKATEAYRTEDVLLDGDDADADFHAFELSDEVVRGLVFEGFEKPSPIQLSAIPIGLTGVDLLLKSKSGTGKTCVFSVIALERTIVSLNKIQVVVISPCREIAVQSQFVIQSIGTFKRGLEVGLFIGGCSLTSNIHQLSTSHIAVGTPGRLVHLIQEFGMDLSSVVLLVLDEADKLFDDSFFPDITTIKESIPKTAQILAVSATFENGMESKISEFMKDPVRIHSGVGGMSLLGVEQYAMDVRKVYNFVNEGDQSLKQEDVNRLKFQGLLDILTFLPYGQAIVFTEFQLKAERIYDQLRREHVDAVLLSGALCQSLRLQAFRQFQKDKVSVLVTTDLGARGLDYELVNLVINYECPKELATYVHRMGRSGRFGSCGRVITLLGYGIDLSTLTNFQSKLKVKVSRLDCFEDIKILADAPVMPIIQDVPTTDTKFTPIQVPITGQSILSFAEALDFLETGGQESLDFAASYCSCPYQENFDADPEKFYKIVDTFMVKAGYKPLFQDGQPCLAGSESHGEIPEERDVNVSLSGQDTEQQLELSNIQEGDIDHVE